MNRLPISIRPAVGGAGAAFLLLLATLSPASAHVDLDADSTSAGSTTLLRFSFTHGCDGSATTGIAIAIPEEIASVYPGMNYGWTVEKITDDAATPVADGNDAEPKVTEVAYTAKEPVPDGFYDELVLKIALPEDAAGETLHFPVIQTCEEGETAWIEVPTEGQDADELESPAPSITVTEAKDEGE